MATRSEAALLKAAATVNAKIRTATEKLNALHSERRDLYLEARSVSPPVQFRKLAAAAETTEAAVMQVVSKGQLAAVLAPLCERAPSATDKQLRAAAEHLLRTQPTLADAIKTAGTLSVKAITSGKLTG